MNLSTRNNWFYTHPTLPTPISVTHESFKNGHQFATTICRGKAKNQINFYSSTRDDAALDKQLENFKRENEEKIYKTSSYRRDFDKTYPSICPKKSILDDNVDPIFNRRPINEFYMLSWAPGKFMDDHFSRPSETRKRINLFRQIRNMSYVDKLLNKD